MIPLSTKKQKARVNHICNFCNLLIRKNDIYNKQVFRNRSEIYNFKSHNHCLKLSVFIFVKIGKNVEHDEFVNFINEEYDNANKGLKNRDFKVKLKTVLNHYKIENNL